MIPAVIILATAAAIAVLPALRLLDNWLSRRLDRAWDADQVDPRGRWDPEATPLFDAAWAAAMTRPEVLLPETESGTPVHDAVLRARP